MFFLFWLMIILILLIVLFFILHFTKLINVENFYTEVCPDCNGSGWVSEEYCYRCLNCGWSKGFDGSEKCIPGNKDGPYYNLNVKDWFYQGKQIWGKVNPRHISREKTPEIHSEPIIFGTKTIPFWKLILKTRHPYNYGERYGRRFGSGMDPRFPLETSY